MIQEPRQVGFWAAPRTAYDSVFGSVLGGLGEMLNPLPRAEDAIDHAWDAKERAAVLHHVTNQAHRGLSCMGWSNCRICACRNGTADFGDGAYVWPEGFGHYISEHAVKPPQDFIDHVLGRAA